MAENLKKTILVDNNEYNINAVYSDEAGKVTHKLTVKESGTKAFDFDGSSSDQVIDYVPADSGGVFKGSVYLDHDKSKIGSSPDDDEVITSAQVTNRVADLNGAPLCIWNTSLVTDDISKSLYESKNNANDRLHKFTTIVGTESDFYILKSLLAGNGAGSSEINYTLSNTISPLIAHWIASSLDSSASGAIVVPSTYTGTYGGSTYTKDVKEVRAIFRENTKITTAVLPKSITKINGQTFQGCTGLLSIVIPDNVTDLSSNSIFDGCTSLNYVVLSKNITTIGVNTFRNCISLTEITIPENVTTINESAFQGCSKLTSIVIPKSLKTVAEYAFDGCDSLETIYYEGNATDWSLIDIQGYNGSFASVEKVYNYVAPTPVVPGTAIDIYEISKGPFIYICRDVESATLPASNKMFLRLPESDDIVEISKGATRLNSTNNVGQDYYTYEGLAEIIARINTRLDAIGGTDLKITTTAFAPLHDISTINSLITEDAKKETINTAVIPTVQDLQTAIIKMSGITVSNDGTTSEISTFINDINNTETLAKLREDLDDLCTEVEFTLNGGPEGTIDSRLDTIDKKISDLEATYGSTTSASGSAGTAAAEAAAATAAKDAAEAAQGKAEAAQGKAEAAQAGAEAAQAAAETAKAGAEAAQGKAEAAQAGAEAAQTGAEAAQEAAEAAQAGAEAAQAGAETAKAGAEAAQEAAEAAKSQANKAAEEAAADAALAKEIDEKLSAGFDIIQINTNGALQIGDTTLSETQLSGLITIYTSLNDATDSTKLTTRLTKLVAFIESIDIK